MSYDIILVPRRPGQSWESALDDDTADPRARLDLQQVWSRIESRLSATLDGEIDSWNAADDDGTTIGELSVMESGLQVELFVGQAAVSFPYWEQEDSEALHRQVTEAVRVVAEETGYAAAYDPQTDQAFDGTLADEEGIAFTQQLTASHGSVDRTAPTPTLVEAPSFYSGRRRAGTYLVIGLIVTLGAGTWLLTGNGGPLAWVALAIGVADLVIGARAWTSSSPPEASV